MSDLQDLIHTNAHNAYEIGVKTERLAIIQLLEQAVNENGKDSWLDAIDLIKGRHEENE